MNSQGRTKAVPSSAWYANHQADVASHERRKSFLGANRVVAMAGAYTLVAVSVLLTALMFAAIANVGSNIKPATSVSTVSQNASGLQVVKSDPLDLQQVQAFLSVPGRVALNGAPAAGSLVASPDQGVPLGQAGALTSGDTLHVCTTLPSVSVDLRLVDAVSGVELVHQTFPNPPLCGT